MVDRGGFLNGFSLPTSPFLGYARAMFVFDAHPFAIIGKMAAIFHISWRRTTERNQIGPNSPIYATSIHRNAAVRLTADGRMRTAFSGGAASGWSMVLDLH